MAYHSLGVYKKAIEFHQLSVSIAKEIREKGLEGTAYTNLVISYNFLGDYKKAVEFHQQSLSIAKGIGEKGSEGTAYTLALRIDSLGVRNSNIASFRVSVLIYLVFFVKFPFTIYFDYFTVVYF